MSISAELAAFSARTHTRELPPAVLARTRHLLLDLAGSIVRGREVQAMRSRASTAFSMPTHRRRNHHSAKCRISAASSS